MKYRKLGKSGVLISEISLGSWYWYPQTAKPDLAQQSKIWLRAFELGINFFDTADIYRAGQEEAFLAKILQELPRNEIVLATKCGNQMGSGPNNRGLSKKHIIESCEDSLHRLGLDYIDLYQFHRPDAETPLEESLSAIELLLRQGKILYWGVSNYVTGQFQELLEMQATKGIEPLVSNQMKYNLFRRDPEETLMPLMHQHGTGLLAYSPLEQGFLTGKYRSMSDVTKDNRLGIRPTTAGDLLVEYNLEAVDSLRDLAEKSGMTLPEFSLAWLLHHETVSTAIIGASRVEQLEANVKASGITLSNEILAETDKILKRRWAKIKINDYQKDL